jgi:isocitrate lyase
MVTGTNGHHMVDEVEALEKRWETEDVQRDYSAQDVVKLRPTIKVEHTLARRGAERLRYLLEEEEHVKTFGALTGAQAVQMVRAGLQAIYVSGWQVAADGNQVAQTYPDQSLYPSNSVPELIKRLNNALMRADQIDRVDGKADTYWYAPIVADAEAGFGGPLHAFELAKGMIEAGVAGIHFEDQLASEKKCGHLGGKVLVPTSQFIRTLQGARLAADVLDVPTVIIARTDAEAATLLTNDIDPRDQVFTTGERTPEGYYYVRNGMEAAVARGLAYAPYADIVWMETKTPNVEEARHFAEAIHAEFPGKMLAYNCSPSFNWAKYLNEDEIATFQQDLAELGYAFQFITLAGWHTINFRTFELAHQYAQQGMTAYVALQQAEFAMEEDGYTATRHQHEVGTGYFDEVLNTITAGMATTGALAGSTEEAQF